LIEAQSRSLISVAIAMTLSRLTFGERRAGPVPMDGAALMARPFH